MSRNCKAKELSNLARITTGIMTEGKTQTQLAQELGMSREGVNKNWNKQMSDNVIDVERQAILKELEELKDEVKLHRKDKDRKLPLPAIDRLIKIVEVVMRVKDIVPTSRSETLNINTEVDPVTMGLYNRFLHECRNLMPEQMEDVWQFIRSLPRIELDVRPPVMALPPSEEDQ